MSAGPRRPGRRRRRSVAWEQLPLVLELPEPRWRFSRLVQNSRYFSRIRERLEFVRTQFPELEGLSIRVGLARKRGVQGWGSLDPDEPGIWVRPRALELFTIAHELTHLLQARGLVPRGERACDLFALARSPALVDTAPGYLRLPRGLRRAGSLTTAQAAVLHRAARWAVAERAQGRRSYLRAFEQVLEKVDWARAAGGEWIPGAAAPGGAVPRGIAGRATPSADGGR